MLSVVRTWRPGIAANSWIVAGLTLLALTSLTLPALRLAEVTTTASSYVSTVVSGGLTTATEVQVKLERHRRLVESAPAEVDRTELERDLATAIAIEEDLAGLIALAHPTLSTAISGRLPELKARREQVFLFAMNFAQDKATETAAQYATIATAFSAEVNEYLTEQRRLIALWSRELADSANTFKLWLWASVVATLIILGPIGMTIIYRMISRLDRLKTVIFRLANHDAAVEVPSLKDDDEVGDIARAVLVFRSNAVALLDSEQKLKAVNQQFDIALSNMSHGMCMFDRHQKVVVLNNRYLELYGLQPLDITVGTTLRDIITLRIGRGLFVGESPEAYLEERLRPVTEATVIVHSMSDGRFISISRRPMRDGGWVTVHEDVTEQQNAARNIAHMANHDALTDLGNRVLLKERLTLELARVRRGGAFALLYLDLDRFKAVNDGLGHPVGDVLLCAVADRLRQLVREVDTVARLGGDEFAILQVDATTPEAAISLASRLTKAISAPYVINGHTIEIGTSIGIALTPRDTMDPDELIKFADMALYRAKETERGSICVYENEIQAHLLARRALERDLRMAIARDQFELHYQPVVDLSTGGIHGAEALLRWRHPQHGQVSPTEFIPLAEETGLIGEIGTWVMHTACRAAVTWPTSTKVAVNLSPAQFRLGNIELMVADALGKTGMDPQRLTIEITESTLLQEDQAVLATLNNLRKLGVSVVLDDFGTGYSSMSYLRRFPFNGLKIYKSFIRDASTQANCVAIVQSIVSLATSLNMHTVAEGVETEADLAMVREAGCTHVQGYLLCRPVPLEHLAAKFATIGTRSRLVA